MDKEENKEKEQTSQGGASPDPAQGAKPPENTSPPRTKTGSIAIPLRLIPSDEEMFARAMEEEFEEDKVVHRQGHSEPEAD